VVKAFDDPPKRTAMATQMAALAKERPLEVHSRNNLIYVNCSHAPLGLLEFEHEHLHNGLFSEISALAHSTI